MHKFNQISSGLTLPGQSHHTSRSFQHAHTTLKSSPFSLFLGYYNANECSQPDAAREHQHNSNQDTELLPWVFRRMCCPTRRNTYNPLFKNIVQKVGVVLQATENVSTGTELTATIRKQWMEKVRYWCRTQDKCCFIHLIKKVLYLHIF